MDTRILGLALTRYKLQSLALVTSYFIPIYIYHSHLMYMHLTDGPIKDPNLPQ